MPAKLELKNKAINLRKQGNSYRNIVKQIGIPKSTLSDWLKNIKLSKKQKDLLNLKSNNANLIGAKVWKNQRIKRTKEIKSKAMHEVKSITDKEMLLLGAMLYWGEGTKQSDMNVSQGVEFVNSDSKMCRFFIKWVTKILGIDTDRLKFGIYINETKKEEKEKFASHWSQEINIPREKINVYFTKNRHSNLKRTNRISYKGQLRIKVSKSTDLNRKIIGWIEGICLQSGIL